MKTVTFTEIQNFLNSKLTSQEIENRFGLILDSENDDPLNYYASETRNTHLFNNDNFSINQEANSITYNESLTSEQLLKQIRHFSDWVYRSYEGELFHWENDAWDQGYCSGDDDVDYNSSYLEIIADTFEYYHNHNK